jgi:hypothetical protein
MIFGIYGAEKGFALTRVDSKSTTETSVEVTKEYKAKYGTLQGQPRASFFFEDFTSSGIDWTTHYVEKNGKQIQIDKIFKCLQIRRELTQFDVPTIYLAYSEVELWLSEIQARNWNLTSESAESHFNKAVLANIQELENILGSEKANAEDIINYQSSIWTSDVDKLKVINLQHYVCNFFNGIEGYANWRRSGYPVLVPADHLKTDASLNGLIPRKMPYPLTELNYNKENVIDHLYNGVNFWGAPVWWDTDIHRGVFLN